jgi:hypothetical protein
MGARETVAALQTEKGFQAAVVEYAQLRGWLTYHTYDSRRSDPGFPDLTLVRDGRLIFIELKSATGRLTTGQHAWLRALRKVDDRSNGAVHAYVWFPTDWPTIEDVLR